MATRGIVPRSNSEGSLGTTLKRWATAFIDTLTLTNPLTVANGGTGRATSTTAYAVMCAGTTATGAHQTIASVGAAAQVLTSNGAAALPTFQAVPALDYGKMIVIGQANYIL